MYARWESRSRSTVGGVVHHALFPIGDADHAEHFDRGVSGVFFGHFGVEEEDVGDLFADAVDLVRLIGLRADMGSWKITLESPTLNSRSSSHLHAQLLKRTHWNYCDALATSVPAPVAHDFQIVKSTRFNNSKDNIKLLDYLLNARELDLLIKLVK